MNDDSGGTPNPLNSNYNDKPNEGFLDANPAEPVQDMAEMESFDELTSRNGNNYAEMEEAHIEMTERRGWDRQEEERMVPGAQPVDFVTGGAYRGHSNESSSNAAINNGTTRQIDSLDPTGRSMQMNVEPVVAPQPKPKKKGLIFGIIGGICLVVGVVAAVLVVMLTMNKQDPVSAAMRKIMSGQAPKNVVIDGDINILMNDPNSPIKRINVDLDSDTVFASMINTSSAVLTLTDSANNDYSARFEEVYAANGNLYFKMEGVTELLENTPLLSLFTVSDGTSTLQEENCITDENGVTNCDNQVIECVSENPEDCAALMTETPATVSETGEATAISSNGNTIDIEESMEAANNSLFGGMSNMLISAIGAAEGVWLKISTDMLNLTDNESSGANSAISCVANLVSDINKNSNSAFEMYDKYPFVTSTNKGVLISSKQNPVYQISLDSKKFTSYINAINNSELSKTLYSCMGWNNNVVVTESDVNQIISHMPKIYAEVNSENNFTRLYLESTINDGAANATIDLGFSYPTNVNVKEPVEYTNYEEFIQTLFTNMFNVNGQPVVEETVVEEQAQPAQPATN
ncbi:hypothetical protein IKE99_00960 [Candidatus Saccharibacteria bacterium]|nr:hypothetical protein [Candidatus Saccharibacteria bacterium]